MTIRIFALLLMSGITVYPTAQNRTIKVHTCDGKLAGIFGDKRLTIPMVNPFLSDADGSYTFYSHSSCIEVEELGQ